MPKFDDSENLKLDRSIRNNMDEMTKKIKSMEHNIKVLSFEKVSSNQEDIGKITNNKNFKNNSYLEIIFNRILIFSSKQHETKSNK
jgi:hypothetical protein